MKCISLIIVLSVSVWVQAADDKLELKKDFSVICATSKAAEALSKDKYITDQAERAALVWNMIEKNIKTDEVKNVIKAVTSAESAQKIKLLKQAAAHADLKNWKCNTLKFLL